jgi:hypothetical protein
LSKCFLAAAGFLPCERNLRLQISDHALVQMLLVRSQIVHLCKCFKTDSTAAETSMD